MGLFFVAIKIQKKIGRAKKAPLQSLMKGGRVGQKLFKEFMLYSYSF